MIKTDRYGKSPSSPQPPTSNPQYPVPIYTSPVWQPSNGQWWVLVCVSLLLVLVWPPAAENEKSLAVKLVNWAADPKNELPVEPEPLGLGLGDDPVAVDQHDTASQEYAYMYAKGGWIRRRMDWKVAYDPINPSTERQVLTAIGIVTALIIWRKSGAKT